MISKVEQLEESPLIMRENGDRCVNMLREITLVFSVLRHVWKTFAFSLYNYHFFTKKNSRIEWFDFCSKRYPVFYYGIRRI